MGVKLELQQPMSGCEMKNVNMKNQVDGCDLFLKREDGKTFRFTSGREGLTFVLINGMDVKITTVNGYPAVCITKK